MDDKTAAIPSLKDFKNKKTASASGKRSSANRTSQRKALSQDTMKLEKIKSASSQRTSNTRSGSSTGTSARSSSAKDRVRTSSDYDSSRRVDRSGQEKRKANVASNTKKPAQTGRERVSSYYYDDVTQKNKSQRSGANKPASASSYNRTAQSGQRQPQKPRTQTAPKRKSAVQNNAPKKNVPKKKKPLSPSAKKFRKAVGFTVLGLFLCIVLLILSLTVFFKAKGFEVNGIERYTKKEIVDASGLEAGDNIFSANKKRAEDRIERMYPYVEEADVYSIFPNKFGIDLTMAKPACKINAMGGIHIVSDKGKVLEVTDNADDVDVPFIEGIQIKARAEGEFVDYGSDVLERALGEMFSAYSQLEATKIKEINVITRDDVFELRYVHDDRIVVYMGIPEDIDYKMQVAEKIIADLDKQEGTAVMGELDVSTCNDEDARSYFNPYSILGPDTTAPATTEEVPEEPTEAYEY